MEPSNTVLCVDSGRELTKEIETYLDRALLVPYQGRCNITCSTKNLYTAINLLSFIHFALTLPFGFHSEEDYFH